MLHPSTKAFLVLAALVVSFVLLSEAIGAVPKVPINDFGPFKLYRLGLGPGGGAGTGTGDEVPPGPGEDANSSTASSVECACPGIDLNSQQGDAEILQIFGYTNTSYIRVQTAEIYNGSWVTMWEDGRFYTGGMEKLPQTSGYVWPVSFVVDPLGSIVGYVPTTLETYAVDVDHLLIYNPNGRTWYSYEAISGEYRVDAYFHPLDVSDLIWDTPVSSPEYLGVPEALAGKLRTLAMEITGSIWSPALKLQAIQTYLQENYVYDRDYRRPREGVDPVDWFLFNEKRGICGNFNSAFILLARSVGIPARLVVGYRVNPDAEQQVVNASQAHAWAEVPFKGAGWTTYDATGSSTEVSGGARLLPTVRTVTTITGQANSAVKGSHFLVNGTVEGLQSGPVERMRVNIYIRQFKDSPGLLCGSGISSWGWFSINCSVPKALQNGDYFLEARSLDNNVYIGSSSDPPISVYSDTTIELRLPKKALTGAGFNIEGRLIDSSTQEPIPYQPLQVDVTNGTLHLTTILNTDFDGNFISHSDPEHNGNWTVSVSYQGFGYFVGSNASDVVKVLTLGITPKPLPAIVRGERTYIEGRVHAEDIPGADKLVMIAGNGIDATTRTDEDGYFSVPYNTTVDSELGPVSFRLTAEIGTFSSNMDSITVTPGNSTNLGGGTVVFIFTDPISSADIQTSETELKSCVYACTTLRIIEQSSSYWHRPFHFTTLLTDDHGAPIAGGNITMTTTHGLSIWDLTAENGTAQNIGLLSSQPSENRINYNLTFTGRDYLQTSHVSGEVRFTAEFGLTEAIPYALPVVAACGAIYYVANRRRPSPHEAISNSVPRVANKSVPERPLGLLSHMESGESMEVRFPRIREPMPFIWGVGDPLEVSVTLSERETKPNEVIYIEGSISKSTLICGESGTATGTITFTDKGYQILTLRHEGQSNRSEVTYGMRLVDYRKEIVDLFNADFEEITRSLAEKGNYHTPRELLDLAAAEKTRDQIETLKELFEIYEEANYSAHLVNRSSYERFYATRLRRMGGH